MSDAGWSLILGATLGLGLWMLVSLAPMLRRPLLVVSLVRSADIKI